jgi:hypothetical protein
MKNQDKKFLERPIDKLLALCHVRSGQNIVREYYESKFGFEVSIFKN